MIMFLKIWVMIDPPMGFCFQAARSPVSSGRGHGLMLFEDRAWDTLVQVAAGGSLFLQLSLVFEAQLAVRMMMMSAFNIYPFL